MFTNRISVIVFALLSLKVHATTYYVNASRPDDTGTGVAWVTAKKTIQAAIDLADEGDTVLVTNGVYNVGSTVTPGVGYSVNNRIVITNAITVKSVNGAVVTIIQGSGAGTYATPQAVRCAYMSNGILDGFMLKGGATHPHTSYENAFDKAGGGVCMLSCAAGTEVRNSIIRDCVAYDGGAVNAGTLVNCVLSGNSAQYGGGAYRSVLINCTVSRNSAVYYGGGVLICGATNSICFGNSDSRTGNYEGGTFGSSCTMPIATGTGNVASDPFFADSTANDFHLTVRSPCVNGGNNILVTQVSDLDGNPRVIQGTVDMGAYEHQVDIEMVKVDFDMQGGSASPNFKTVTVGAAYGLLPTPVRSGFGFGGWWSDVGGTGSQVSEQTTVAVNSDHTLYALWTLSVTSAAGFGGTIIPAGCIPVAYGDRTNVLIVPSPNYSIADVLVNGVSVGQPSSYTFDNVTSNQTIYASFARINADSKTYYVDASRPDDTGTGVEWATAKKTIQAAIDLTVEGDTVLVTNGVYRFGTTVTPGVGYSVNNRIVITKAITVKSVNGAIVTIIEGSGAGTYATPQAVRCAYMSNGILDGFTLKGGATHPHTSYENAFDKAGGGVCMLSCATGTEVRNSIIRDCVAYDGGAVNAGTLVNCVLSGNTAQYGGGAYRSALISCTVTKNRATFYGGGALVCGVTNSICFGNSDFRTGNYEGGTFAYSCTKPISAGTGNVANDPLFVDSANNNFRLQASSPCRDAGSNAAVLNLSDLDGIDRITNGTVDMGAYEYDAPHPFTLTVNSVHGGASPGTLSAGFGSMIDLWVTNSPVVCGTTQYICVGSAVAGNVFEQVCTTNVILTLTNNAALTWQWTTKYLLAALANGNGSVMGGGWYAAGNSVSLTAVPDADHIFTGWSDGELAAYRTVVVPPGGAIYTANFKPIMRGTLRFQKAIYSVSEGLSFVKLTVERIDGTYGEALVDVLTLAGTAQPDVDFSSDAGYLRWADGQGGSKSVFVEILPDDVYEGNEVFSARLTNAVGASIGTPETADVTIVDNEGAPHSIPRFSGNLEFGEVATNAVMVRTVDIWNDGNQLLFITNVSLSAGFSVTQHVFSVPVGEAVTLSVWFAPRELIGYSGLLTLECNATSGAVSLAVSGSGVVPVSSVGLRTITGLTAVIAVDVPEKADFLGVEDTISQGLVPAEISDGGTWDAVNRKVKWFFTQPGQVRDRALQYRVSGVGNVVTGLMNFGSGDLVITGDTTFTSGDDPGLLHPADDNGDWHVVLNEVSANVNRWKSGLDNQKTPVVVRGIMLYLQGEQYAYDPQVSAEAKRWIPMIAPAPVGIAAYATLTVPSSEPQVDAVRTILTTNVTVTVAPKTGTIAWGMEESVPEGINVCDISNDGAWDANHRRIKWTFFDGAARTLSYSVYGQSGISVSVSGTVSFDGSEEPVTGASVLAVPLPFNTWANRQGLDGETEAVFQAHNAAYGQPNGLVYAFQSNLMPGDHFIDIVWKDGLPLIETPTQDPATLTFVDVTLEWTADLTSPEWLTGLVPAADQSGVSVNRCRWVPLSVPNNAFYRLRAILK